jgi:hypothetical protein
MGGGWRRMVTGTIGMIGTIGILGILGIEIPQLTGLFSSFGDWGGFLDVELFVFFSNACDESVSV